MDRAHSDQHSDDGATAAVPNENGVADNENEIFDQRKNSDGIGRRYRTFSCRLIRNKRESSDSVNDDVSLLKQVMRELS
jgi:hypothetical protein